MGIKENPTQYSLSHSRDIKDTAEDILLLLYLMKKSGENISGDDSFKAKVKLLKLVFLAQKSMIDKKMKGFNLFYNVYKHGPSSMELLHLIDDLQVSKLIEFDISNNTFSLAPKGRSLINDFEEQLGSKNKFFFKEVDNVVAKYGELAVNDLLRAVYAMNVVPQHGSQAINIGEAVQGESKKRLLMKLDRKYAKSELDVPADWVETVNLLMNPKFTELV